MMVISEWVSVIKFNGTSTPKGSYRAKTGDNDYNVNSSRYSPSTALCESIRYQAKSEQTVRQDPIPRVPIIGYQVLSDILFRLGLIANCSHTVQYLDCGDLNWRCNHLHLFWHCMTPLVLMCRKTVLPPPPPKDGSVMLPKIREQFLFSIQVSRRQFFNFNIIYG